MMDSRKNKKKSKNFYSIIYGGITRIPRFAKSENRTT